MATEVVSTIRSSGGDYTSLFAWEAGEQGDLTGVRDEISVAECYDDWPSGLTGGVIIDGWTTDATRYIKVTVAAGHRHNGIDPTSGFYLAANANSRNDLRIYEGYTVVEYVGHIFSTYTGCSFVLVSAGTGHVVRNCVSTDTAAASNNRSFWVQNAGSNVTWQCCLSIAAGVGFHVSNSGVYTALNCVAANCTTGFAGSSNSVVKNCVAYNNTTNYSGTFSGSSTHNATSSGSDDAPGGSSVTGVSSSDFVDASNNDFHLASGSALIGAGTNLYSDFTTDIDGDTWPSSGAWDIGFDYRVAGSSPQTVATGQTLTATASLVAGAASGQVNATAAGATVTADASLIAGAAAGESGGTAAGATVAAAASLITGAAQGEQNATAAGQTLTAAASLIAGAASGGSTGTAAGATLQASASLLPGAATGEQNATAAGATITATASLQAGAATAGNGATAGGVLLVAGASIIVGAATAANDATAAGVVIEAAAQFLAGAATGQADATAPGAVIACQVIIIRGGAFGPNLTPTPGFTAALAQRNFNATIAPAIRTATRRAA